MFMTKKQMKKMANGKLNIPDDWPRLGVKVLLRHFVKGKNTSVTTISKYWLLLPHMVGQKGDAFRGVV